MMSLNKRKRVVVSLQQKLEAIKRLDQGESIKRVAHDLGVGEVTVGDWKRKRSEIEKWCGLQASDLSTRKTMKNSEFETVSEALYVWFTQQRSKGIPLSGPILQEKAKAFSQQTCFEDNAFTASSGWLDRWKRRYGVRQLNVCGEILSANNACIDQFRETFNKFLIDNNLGFDQVYNADETGLNFKMLPRKSLASREESAAPGYKKSKERITIMACSNASGRHKLPLVCVGKSAKPRALKNVAASALPVYYTNQKNAWMDVDLFKTWFFHKFVPDVENFLKINNLPIKAVLLIDNAPSHPNENELVKGDISVKFLPPNVTSLIQPMDQGVLENLKKNYRCYLLTKILQQMENETLLECLRNINLKNVVYWVSQAWNDVRPSTIQKSWMRIFNIQVKEEHEEEETNLYDLVKKIRGFEEVSEKEIEEWVDNDEEYELTDTEILEAIKNQEEISLENECEVEKSELMSHQEGLRHLENALKYVEQQPEATGCDVLLIKRWRDIAAKKRFNCKQLTID